MLQDLPDTKDTSPWQSSREASHQHHQDATRSKDRGICKGLRRSHLHKKPSKYSIGHLVPPTECIHTSALAIFGKKTSRSSNWFNAKSAEMTPVIEAKWAALTEYKHSPSEKTFKTLRAARSKVQQTARKCANEYWQELSCYIQTAGDTGNIRGIYDGITKALGPTQSKTAPLKSISGEVITDKGKQMEGWVEHYSELYSRENSVVDSALDAIEPLPITEDSDAEPTLEDSARLSTAWSAAKPLEQMAFLLISSSAASLVSCNHYTTPFASAGVKGASLKI